MSGDANRFRIDRSRIIAQAFDDETVLVDMDSGFYYSISPAASEVLELLDGGWPVEAIGGQLFAAEADGERYRGAILEFVEQLKGESIVVACAAEENDAVAPSAPSRKYAAGEAYELPRLERYDDMRELLLIDPVHQVDRSHGWPKMPGKERSIES
jgi:hypothetical protein